MIKRPHNYTGECIDCTYKEQCRFRYECPFIDNESRLKSHRKRRAYSNDGGHHD